MIRPAAVCRWLLIDEGFLDDLIIQYQLIISPIMEGFYIFK